MSYPARYGVSYQTALPSASPVALPSPVSPLPTINCPWCTLLLSYPYGASIIRCPACNNTSQLRVMAQLQLSCLRCHTLLSYFPHYSVIQCPSCQLQIRTPSTPSGQPAAPSSSFSHSSPQPQSATAQFGPTIAQLPSTQTEARQPQSQPQPQQQQQQQQRQQPAAAVSASSAPSSSASVSSAPPASSSSASSSASRQPAFTFSSHQPPQPSALAAASSSSSSSKKSGSGAKSPSLVSLLSRLGPIDPTPPRLPSTAPRSAAAQPPVGLHDVTPVLGDYSSLSSSSTSASSRPAAPPASSAAPPSSSPAVLTRMAHLSDGFVPLQEESVVAYERWDGGERDGRGEGEQDGGAAAGARGGGAAAGSGGALQFRYGEEADDSESELRRDEPSVYHN